MRIRHFDLIAYGPFTNQALDFSDDCGLHIIQGDNEAGKTSALEAIRHALFGIPQQNDFNFIHDYDDLELGARLVNEAGESLEFVRKKKRKNPLTDPHTGAEIKPEALERFLGGLSEADFRSRFTFTHDELREGGETLADGKGDFSEVFFAASSGLGAVHEVLERLKKRADEMFTKRKSDRPIHRAIDACLGAAERARKAALIPAEWRRLSEEVAGLRSQKRQFTEQISTLKAELSRINRVRSGLVPLAKLRTARGKLQSLGAVPRFSPEELKLRQEQAALRLKLMGALESAKAELEAMQGSEQTGDQESRLIAIGGELDTLDKRLSAHEARRDDRDNRADRAREHRRTAATILHDLDPSSSLEPDRDLRIAFARRKGILDLAERDETLANERLIAQRDLDSKIAARDRLAREISSLAPPAETVAAELASALEAAQGDLSAALEEARADVSERRALVYKSLAKLGFAKTPDEIERLGELPVPSQDIVRSYETRFDALDKRLGAADERLSAIAAELIKVAQTIDTLTLVADVPSEAELFAARAERDHAWSVLRRAIERIRQDAPDPAGLEQRLVAYELLARRCDELADRLRREAERVQSKAAESAKREALGREADLKKGERDSAVAEREALNTEWSGLWAPSGAAVCDPIAMRNWLTEHERGCERLGRLREAERKEADLASELNRKANRLAQALAAAGAPAEPGTAIEVLKSAASSLLKRDSGIRSRIDTLANELDAVRLGLDESERALEALDRDRKLWSEEWLEAVADCELLSDSHSKNARKILDRIKDALDARDSALQEETHVERFDTHEQEIRSAIQAHATAFGIAGGNPAAVMARFREDLARARTEEGLREKLRTSNRALREIETGMQALAQRAGCSTIDELEPAIARAREAELQDAEIKTREAELLELGAGKPLEDFIAEIEAEDPDALDERAAAIDAEIAAAGESADEVQHALGAREQELRAAESGAGSIDSAQEAEQSRAEIERLVAEYLPLRIAHSVLIRFARDYREKNQGAILPIASAFFQRLTLGSFSRLLVDEDDKGAVILKAQRPDRKSIKREHMSDGTRDQLYLALRLAGLAHQLDIRQPVPFIVDDVLVHFDDARSAAALAILAELAQKTQVLFFTHHRHLVELARAGLPANAFSVHELARSLAPVATPPAEPAPQPPRSARSKRSTTRRADSAVTASDAPESK